MAEEGFSTKIESIAAFLFVFPGYTFRDIISQSKREEESSSQFFKNQILILKHNQPFHYYYYYDSLNLIIPLTLYFYFMCFVTNPFISLSLSLIVVLFSVVFFLHFPSLSIIHIFCWRQKTVQKMWGQKKKYTHDLENCAMVCVNYQR